MGKTEPKWPYWASGLFTTVRFVPGKIAWISGVFHAGFRVSPRLKGELCGRQLAGFSRLGFGWGLFQ